MAILAKVNENIIKFRTNSSQKGPRGVIVYFTKWFITSFLLCSDFIKFISKKYYSFSLFFGVVVEMYIR